MATEVADIGQETKEGFIRGLGLLDSTMIVAGSMIGSGIFIVSADISRQVGAPGWLLVVWLITGFLTIVGALSYGELAAMMPKAGGQYVYLREAYSPLWGFLYGWTLFLVIQTATIAAVAVAFARYSGLLIPWISEANYLVEPVRIGSSSYAFSISTAQLVGIAMIALLTFMNTRGLKLGKLVQNVFTFAKTGSLIALIVLGIIVGLVAYPEIAAANFGDLWDRSRQLAGRWSWLDCRHYTRVVRRHLCGSDEFALLSRCVEQHHVYRGRG
jgi:APA family basic amino acid/polyamine antiporter